ncbi:MAG: TRAP transporter fused permease subunit, partial [Dehalobacterium sp.]
KLTVVEYGAIFLSIALAVYILIDQERLITRHAFFDPVMPFDYVFTLIALLLVLEATRRVVGYPLMLVSAIFLLYIYVGQYLPGLFHAPSFGFDYVAEITLLTTSSIYGLVLGVAASYVIMFCLFGSFLTRVGAADFFFDGSMKLAGRARGGIAKTSVVSSALFGMINGDPISNTITTGNFTIPTMKRANYPAHLAAATETASSCGGTILPPVMGSVAFVMAEVVGLKYGTVMKLALIPGLLYYLAVFIGIDSMARKFNLRGVSAEELPKFGSITQWGRPFLITVGPVIWLVTRILKGSTPPQAAGESIAIMIIFSLLLGGIKRIKFKDMLDALEEGATNCLLVGIATAAAGIVVGAIKLTGVGPKFTSAVMLLAENNLPIALLLAALVTIILGMGMSITPTYILASSLVAPGLIELGTPALAVHMFIVYYAAMATMTPPVALSAYTSAGIAGADPFKVGFTAVRLGIVAYLIPFVFIYRPGLLMFDTVLVNIITVVFVALGVVAIAYGLAPIFIKHNTTLDKCMLILAALMLWFPNNIVNIVGAVLMAIVVIIQIFMRKEEVATENALPS